MRIAIVGQGASANDQGDHIDSFPYVIRIKSYRIHGPTNSGHQVHAWAWYGNAVEFLPHPILPPPNHCEHWFTHAICQPQLTAKPNKFFNELSTFIRYANGKPTRFLTNLLWKKCSHSLSGLHPSTGYVTIAMAEAYLLPQEIHLFGFDCVSPETADDARRTVATYPHPQHLEKQNLSNFSRTGFWLGALSTSRLIWHNPPEIP